MEVLNMKDSKPINIKLDKETKQQFKTLAFIKDMKLQELGVHLIKQAIAENKEQIDKIQSIKTNK